MFYQRNQFKSFLSYAIFTGAVTMLVVFLISLFLPKEWLVSGKIVVFPSGQPASASQNLLAETGNTAEIVKSESFRKANFGGRAANFAGAKVLKNSSMVLVKFRSGGNDIRSYEDLIVKIPGQVDEYARDLYSGSPFKYKIVSDPEISASPVRPNLLLNSIFGFLGGALLYMIYYWTGFESKQPEGEEIDAETEKVVAIVSPEIKLTEKAEKKEAKTGKLTSPSLGGGKVVVEKGKPHFAPGEKTETIEKRTIFPKSNSAAPDNLPFVDEMISSSSIQEPSDDEVKERLNRLMRGEL
ncbi:MAG: hypothetical protein WC643_00205 [Parcubacteria group bacterium]